MAQQRFNQQSNKRKRIAIVALLILSLLLQGCATNRTASASDEDTTTQRQCPRAENELPSTRIEWVAANLTLGPEWTLVHSSMEIDDTTDTARYSAYYSDESKSNDSQKVAAVGLIVGGVDQLSDILETKPGSRVPGIAGDLIAVDGPEIGRPAVWFGPDLDGIEKRLGIDSRTVFVQIEDSVLRLALLVRGGSVSEAELAPLALSIITQLECNG
jgi:hypothetical protein